MSSIYLVSDPRMTSHRPVPPPPGQEQHRQLNPPCERPERIVRIMERMQHLETSLIDIRRSEITSKGPKLDAAVPFVRSNCQPVSRDTVTLLHPGQYYDKLRATSNLSDAELHQMTLATLSDEDVYYHRDTFLAATLACGGVVSCVDAVLRTGAGAMKQQYQSHGYASTDEEEQGNESPRDVASFADGNSSDNGSGSISSTPYRTANTHRALAIVRPPGHHACQSRSMGFCFLNSVAVAAKHALTQHPTKCQRVLILDWDVHHGNGTQLLTYDDPNILYVSLHRIAKQGSNLYFFPGTGRPDEVGHGAAEGANLNVAWDVKNVGNVEYAAAFSELVLPLVNAFDPNLVMISCGFDAAQGDLIGDCLLSPEMYYRMTRSLLATVGADVPTVVALEGGYNLDVITDCAEAVALALLDEPWERRLEVASVSEVMISMSASDESPSRLPQRDEIFRSPVDSDTVEIAKDTSMRSLGELRQDSSCASFNASTIMESVRHIIDEEESNGGAGEDDGDSSSTGSLDINSSLRHLKAVDGGIPASISSRSVLPSPGVAPPPPTPEQRLRAGRRELASFWNFESPSPRMKGMGAKKSAIRCINQSIRAVRNTSRWRNDVQLQIKEVANQNEFGPVILTRNRRGAAAAQGVEDMNASLGNFSVG